MVVRHLAILKIRLADGFTNNRGGLGHADIPLPQQFARLATAEVEPEQRLGGRSADVACGNHGELQVRTERAGSEAHHFDNADLRESVLHEVGGAQVQNVQSSDAIEPLLELMQAYDGAGFVRLVRADATE